MIPNNSIDLNFYTNGLKNNFINYLVAPIKFHDLNNSKSSINKFNATRLNYNLKIITIKRKQRQEIFRNKN